MARHMGVRRWIAVRVALGLTLLAVAGGLTASSLADVVTTTVASTTTPETTTAPDTTASTTTTAPPTTTTTPAPAPVPVTNATVTDRALTSGCPVSAVAVLRPGRVSGLVGPVAAAPGDGAVLDRLRYAVDGTVFSGDDVRVSGGGCGGRASVSIGSVSLFDGALSASSIGIATGDRDARSISGLRVGNASASGSSTRWLPLGQWGEWRIGSTGAAVAALTVKLVRPHAGLPAGTTLLVAVAGTPAKVVVAAHHTRRVQHHAMRRRRRTVRRGMPLKVTPPLTVSHEIFPVVGTHAAFVDTYGALRSDVPGNWHHGDDIFAPLGTPVVAVADGTINRVGWNPVGGWRLWVRDDGGDEFYYAHLSGYTRATLRSKRVRAGEVIGFVGNTGDAITTSPHLHFEIHPRSLLHLEYNGAVDPTGYLHRWTHIDHVRAPKPAHPALPPQQAVRAQARGVWRELLSARHLVPHRAAVKPTFPHQRSLASAEPAAPPTETPRPSHATPALLVVGPLVLLTGLAGAALGYYRRRARRARSLLT